MLKSEMSVSPSFQESLIANLAFWQARLKGLPETQFHTLDPESQNLSRAVAYGLGIAPAQEPSVNLALTLMEYVESRGIWRAWIPLFERALSLAAVASPLQGRLACRLGFLYRLDERLLPALDLHRQALHLAEARDDRFEEARAHLGLADEYYLLHQYVQAETHTQAGLDHLKAIEGNDPWKRAAHNLLGMIAHTRGEYAAAATHYRAALEAWPPGEYPRKQAQTLTNLANTLRDGGRPAEALAALELAIALLQQTGSRLPLAIAQLTLGTVFFSQGDFARALAAFLGVDNHFLTRFGYRFPQALLANNIGNVYLEQGAYPAAEEQLAYAVQLWREVGDEVNLANTLGDLGEACYQQGFPERAAPFWEEALALLARHPENAWARKRYHAILAQTKR